jgi:hypothetical protein
MDVLQINYWDFFVQSIGLAAWICVVAGVYSVVEKAVEGPSAAGSDRPQ